MHAFAHVTGGGIPGNLVRVLPDRCDGVVVARRVGGAADLRARSSAPATSPTPRWSTSSTSGSACSRSCRHDAALHAVDVVRSAGHDAWIVGEVVDGHGRVRMERH